MTPKIFARCTKITILWFLSFCTVVVSCLSQAQDKPGYYIKITYLGNIVYNDGGVRKHMKIPKLLHSIHGQVDDFESEIKALLRPEIVDLLPSSLRLNYFNVTVGHRISFQLASQGGGNFGFDYSGTPLGVSARVGLKNASFLANASLDIGTSLINASGTYNIYNGNASVTVHPPFFSVSADYGGLGAEFINLITFGAVDNLFNDFLADQEAMLVSQVDDLVSKGFNTASFSLFGIDQIIPEQIPFNGINYSGQILQLIQNIPSGTIATVEYIPLWLNKYKSRLVFKVGNQLVIELNHWNSNGTHVGPCPTRRC